MIFTGSTFGTDLLKEKFLLLLIAYFFGSMVYGQVAIDGKGNKKPYTYLPDRIGETYRFVIIGDLTGGEEPGVFDYAIERINELAPDFVMCVGDLVEGYTKDKDVIDGQWERFNGSLAKLEVPFFYMAGNHDVGNPVLQQDWDERFGTAYYTFTVNSDLFIVLNTFEPDVDGISQQQADYLKEKILAHPKENRLFVFSHDALWLKFDEHGIKELAPLLQERNTTYFCGHEHRYLNKTHLGQQHYMLAGVATGDPGMRGIELGEFHNLMYATSSPSKFSLSNIKLEGLLPLRVVSNETEKQVEIALRGEWAKIVPTVSDSQFDDNFESNLILSNTGDYPLHVAGKFESESLNEAIDYILAVGEEKIVPLNLVLDTKSDILKMDEVILKLRGRFDQPGTNIQSSPSVRWVIDNIHVCELVEKVKFFTVERFGAIDEDWDWHGAEDGSIRYKVSSDKKNIYIDIETIDDVLLTNRDKDAVQDKISVFFSADTTFQSKEFAQFDFVGDSKVQLNKNSTLKMKGVGGDCTVKDNSLIARLVIPRKYAPDETFRLNFSFLDLDDPKEIDPSVLWWKPRWGSSKDYSRSGVFVIE